VYSVPCLFYLTTCVCVCHSFHASLRDTFEPRCFRILGSCLMYVEYIMKCIAQSSWPNPKNKGKSYTTFHEPIVSAEWLRLIRLKYPNAPHPPSGNVSSRHHAHFLLHHLSLCSNLHKLPPYLTICGHRNPMPGLRLRSQSHQSIPTHMLTLDDNNQRDTYDSRVCLCCPSGVTGLEIHLILECPTTSHVVIDLIQLLTNLLYDRDT